MNTDELDSVIEWYTISADTHKSMKYLINKKPEVIPLKSILTSKSLDETNNLMDTAMEELNDQTIISLVSTFEQLLIGYLRETIDVQMKIETKNEVFINIKNYTMNLAERGHFHDLINLFKNTANNNLAGIVKQIYQYRNWVAHGKRAEKTPAKTDSISAHYHLSEFLKNVKEEG